MSRRDSCHGCEGKGWVQVILRERTKPFWSQGNEARVDGIVADREYGAVVCPICKGAGVLSREAE